MTTRRAPKLGEIWTDDDDTPHTCIDDQPDRTGQYGWSRPSWTDDGSVYKEYSDTTGLTPPDANPPEWLTASPWHAVLESGHLGPTGCPTPAAALSYGHNFSSTPIGAINVTTGEWVPK